ncbi:MAG: tRNA pseudouridine(13) synthase TruD [Candidatus Absconditabacteria bacterium]|nr:tRNA pseudouridine(13) synthase TruD [Candidatus Absconditabacteria bacterium]MDD3868266.1 tRNA pseudouridine(13) synthase TruD [Candidatus Absconditabacteria bacterium]MDD4714606.1 tRNA pseudouridine(13) synthase TruD [Candidatus Absconditabacteria bacterium]
MLYQFKSKAEDFLVEELLPQAPKGEGDVFYVFFEKKNLTTIEVLEHLGAKLKISREDLGIAGLKDKVGITRQRISVYKSILQRIGGEVIFCACLEEICKILKTTWSDHPLRIANNAGNRFVVRLRSTGLPRLTGSQGQEIKNQISANIEKVKERGFPNCFGSQRFGKRNKNFLEAKKIMESGISGFPQSGGQYPYHLKFMLQAYASMYFNEYVMYRREKSQLLLGGDILVDRFHPVEVKTAVYENQEVHLFDYLRCKRDFGNQSFFEPHHFNGSESYDPKKRFPTGPMLGNNLLLAPQGSKARVRDDLLLELAEFNEQAIEVCKLYQLRGVRRALRVKVGDFAYSFEGNDLLLNFSLPTGSYATVLLAFVLEGIDGKTLRENRLEIPRI